jgi:16S rRNA G966 N2-methylase RsmD
MKPPLIDALAATAAQLGRLLWKPTSPTRAFLAADRREFDVIFADPPFKEDPWAWLLPACAARLTAHGLIYAEAGVSVAPPTGRATYRSDKAGQVHYHLFAGAR